MMTHLMFTAEQFVAHRGYARHYPENTLTAFTAAVRAGARCIELDIQFSKDGIPFLYHDDNLLRVSGIDASIFDYSAEQLIQIPAYEPERFGERFMQVPITLADEFAQMVEVRPFIHFYIELKEESIERFGRGYCLQALAQLFNRFANVTLISFDLEAMRLAKTLFDFKQTGIVFRDWANRNALIDANLADIAYINIKRIPAAERIEANCPIAIYEVDDPVIAQDALQRGISKIETYAIGEMIEALCKPNMT